MQSSDRKRNAFSDHRRGAWGLIVVLVFVAMTVSSCGSADDDDDSGEEVATLTDTVKMPSGQRILAVSLTSDLVRGAKVTANVEGKRPPGQAMVRGTRVNAADDQFTIVMDKPAPKPGLVIRWNASEVKSDSESQDSGGTRFEDKWLVMLGLMLLVIGLSFAAFWIAVWQRGSDGRRIDNGLEFVSFLKVSALITIAAIALIGVMLATEEESKNLGALFGLLGAIAGYLAGNKPTSEDDSEADQAPPAASVVPGAPPGPGAPGAPGAPAAPAQPAQAQPKRRTVRRSLL